MAFSVIWENLPLQINKPSYQIKLFTFGAAILNTCDIIFGYKTIQMTIEDIQDEKHVVNICLSDGYTIDRTIFCK